MAARRGKSQATRNSSHATPAWVWLLLGLLIGLAVYFIAPGLLKKDGDGFFRPQPNPDAQPAPVASADVEAVVPESASRAQDEPVADAPKEKQYDFYTLLPGKEVQMSDAELAASAREEEARRAREEQRAAAAIDAATAVTAATPATVAATPVAEPARRADPQPIDETPAQAPVARSTAPRPAVVPATTPAKVASADTTARYILQAGAFEASGDAEATKAKIALLGLSARVEAAQINGRTVYRVRMGPYGTASELAEAKRKLASGGLPAMAVKAQ